MAAAGLQVRAAATDLLRVIRDQDEEFESATWGAARRGYFGKGCQASSDTAGPIPCSRPPFVALTARVADRST